MKALIAFNVLAITILLTQTAYARIESFSELGSLDVKCVQKIARAIEKEDKKGGLPSIGKNASLSIDEVTGGRVKEVAVTVNELDNRDGYSIWSVSVRGTDAKCKVLDVVLDDMAH